MLQEADQAGFERTLASCAPEHELEVYSPPPEGWVKSKGPEAALLIAAHSNDIAEVKCLVELSKTGQIDLEYEGCVNFPGEKPVEGATSLWTAATCGHWEVVEILLAAGADINHTTKSSSTPLRGASFDGNIDVVRCLLKHGAAVNVANRMKQTPLSIASGKGHVKVVELLLTHGADVNICSTSGDTPLHSASEAGHEKIVSLLLEAGAEHRPSREGWTPLILAAAAGHKGIVELILKHANNRYSVGERADALELLGATLLDLHHPKETPLALWKKAIELRTAFNQPKKNILPPMEVYGNCTEAVTLEDLRELELDDEYLYTNCLLIRERVLTKEHPQTPYYVRIHGDYFLAILEWDRAQLCWLHALEMDQFNDIDSLDLSIVSTIAENVLICTMGLRHIEEETSRQVNFLPYFNWCLNCLKIAMKSGAVLDQLLVAALQMLGWWMSRLPEISFPPDDFSLLSTKQQELLKSTYKLVRLRCLIQNGGGLLHLCVGRLAEVVLQNHIRCVHELPSPAVVKLLLLAGESLNMADSFGNTPMHYAAAEVITQVSCGGNVSGAIATLKLLLQAGAHQDVYNWCGVSPRQMLISISASLPKAVAVFVSGVLPLQCLAARSLAKSGIAYDTPALLPPHLAALTQLHSNRS